MASNFGLNTSVLDHTPPPALTMESVAGVMVSIVAFQAVDPGSIPGPRTPFFLFGFFFLSCKQIGSIPGLEPGSEPEVPTIEQVDERKKKKKKNKKCLDRGSNTGPLDLQSNALPTELSKQVTITERSTCGLEWFADSQKKKCQNRSLIAGLAPMVSKNKKPTGGIEPPTFRLQSECSTTKLSRRASAISDAVRHIYRYPPIAQLAERETVDG